MIHPMPDPLADPPSFNAIFIQPTYSCALNCKDCYVKARREAGPLLSAMATVQLVKEMKYYANQVTIAVDEPPGRETSSDGAYFHMEHVFRNLGHYDIDHYLDSELHVTMRSPETFNKYGYAIPKKKRWDVVSFSSLPHPMNVGIGEIILSLREAGTHINWNFMVPQNLPEDEDKLEPIVAKFADSLCYVDSCYFILRKSPIGKLRTMETVSQDRLNMRNDLRFYQAVKKYLDYNELKKINIDGCLSDVVKFREEGFGCSAGISTFHVWPDGSVTGCPYAYSSWTGPAIDTEGVIENIRKVYLAYKEGRYDFNRCHLPQTYGNVSRQSRT